MKVVIILSLLVAAVLCEKCKHDDECSVTSCSGNGFDVRCTHDVCTCVAHCGSDHKCAEKKECEKEAVKNSCQCNEGMHCIDKQCYCGYPVNSNTTMV